MGWAGVLTEQRRGGRSVGAQLSVAGRRDSPEDLRARIAGPDVAARDAVLLALAQAGDVLAGRTVLQAMLGKAVRVAASAAPRAEFGGDQHEALVVRGGALWQVIQTYPVARRPSRVAGRGSRRTWRWTRSRWCSAGTPAATCAAAPDVPTADIRTVAEDGHLEQAAPEPADAELYTGCGGSEGWASKVAVPLTTGRRKADGGQATPRLPAVITNAAGTIS